jgi:amino acid transporter
MSSDEPHWQLAADELHYVYSYNPTAEFYDFYYSWMTSTVIVAAVAGYLAWRYFDRAVQGARPPQSIFELILIVVSTALAVVGVSVIGTMLEAPGALGAVFTGLIGGICAASVLQKS